MVERARSVLEAHLIMYDFCRAVMLNPPRPSSSIAAQLSSTSSDTASTEDAASDQGSTSESASGVTNASHASKESFEQWVLHNLERDLYMLGCTFIEALYTPMKDIALTGVDAWKVQCPLTRIRWYRVPLKHSHA